MLSSVQMNSKKNAMGDKVVNMILVIMSGPAGPGVYRVLHTNVTRLICLVMCRECRVYKVVEMLCIIGRRI